MKKKFIRKGKYKNYIKIADEKKKYYKKNSVISKRIIKIIIYFTILSLAIFAILKIIFRKKENYYMIKMKLNQKLNN